MGRRKKKNVKRKKMKNAVRWLCNLCLPVIKVCPVIVNVVVTVDKQKEKRRENIWLKINFWKKSKKCINIWLFWKKRNMTLKLVWIDKNMILLNRDKESMNSILNVVKVELLVRVARGLQKLWLTYLLELVLLNKLDYTINLFMQKQK